MHKTFSLSLSLSLERHNEEMNVQYDSSFDVGVAVEAEEKKLPSALPTSNAKAKRRRLLSTADTDTTLLDHAESTDNSVVSPPITVPLASATRKHSKRCQKCFKSGEMVGGVINAKLPAVDVSPPPPPLKGMFIEERKKLPVYGHRAEICNLVSINDAVLVVAETVSRPTFHDTSQMHI